ncbi:MAG: phosphoribosylformylglycinamidine synthase subunit PurQ, partial [Clostridia bacterium]
MERKNIVDVSREFLNSNGAEKHTTVAPEAPNDYTKTANDDFIAEYQKLASDLNICSKRGLSERFDSTIGAGTVLMPFGGKNQLTPIQAMVQKISSEKSDTDDCSFMAWGYNPFITEKSPFHGAYLAVIESVCKLIATGAEFKDVYLTFQEYFEKPNKDSKRWGKPFAALLGAFKAQTELQIAAIGGKDSMSGSFEKLDVPPTLVSFAVTTGKTCDVVSPEFKKSNHKVIIITPEYDQNGLPITDSLKDVFSTVTNLIREKIAVSVYTPTYGGIAEGVMKMCFGNTVGFKFAPKFEKSKIFSYNYGSFIVELEKDCNCGTLLGYTDENPAISYNNDKISLQNLLYAYENKLEPVYSCNIATTKKGIPKFSYNKESVFISSFKTALPLALIPVFPGTNCEYDTAKAIERAGGKSEIIVINNLSSKGISESVEYFASKLRSAQIVIIPGGFSGGDEPDGSGKFITAFFRNAAVKQEITSLLETRDGLMCGICNGFQAL